MKSVLIGTNPLHMKKINILWAIVTSIILLFTSCSTNKLTTAKLMKNISESETNTFTNFVKKKDGSVVYYKSLELVKGVFSAPHLLADGKIKILPSEIVAYQNENHYAVSQSTFVDGKKSNVAVETLPGFAVRVVYGKLNIYCKKYFNGRAAVDEFYIQSGNDGKIFTYTPELMKRMIQDNQEALTYFNNEKLNSAFPKKLQTTAEMYNNALLMSKN